MCDKNECSKIVGRKLESNRWVYYTENGGKYVPVDPQYRGPVATMSGDGKICPNSGYSGYGLGNLF